MTRKTAQKKTPPATPETARASRTGARYQLVDADGRRHITRARDEATARLLGAAALGVKADALDCEVTGG
jgi:hypothetical protein